MYKVGTTHNIDWDGPSRVKIVNVVTSSNKKIYIDVQRCNAEGVIINPNEISNFLRLTEKQFIKALN